MSANSQVSQTNSTSASGGVLGSGYAAVSSAAIGKALTNLYSMLVAQNLLKQLNIQNILTFSQAQSKHTIEEGKKQRTGAYLNAFTQGAMGVAGGTTALTNWVKTGQAYGQLDGIKNGVNNQNLKAITTNNPLDTPDDAMIDYLIDNGQNSGFIPERHYQIKNYANEEQRVRITSAAETAANPADKAYFLQLSKESTLEQPLFDKALKGKDLLNQAEIDRIQMRASPKQREQLVSRANALEAGEAPEQKSILDNLEKGNQLRMHASQRIFDPVAQAAGSASQGMFTAEAAAERANASSAQAGEQAAAGSNSTVAEALNQIMSVIQGLMQVQQAMAQATR